MWVHVQKTTLKETVLWGTITWSEMGKQNIQAKKVSSITIESILVFLSYLIFLANLCEEFNLQPGVLLPFLFWGPDHRLCEVWKIKPSFVQESKTLSDSGSSSSSSEMSLSCKRPITVGNQGRTQRPLTLKRKETALEDLPILEILLTTGLCFALSERQNDLKGWKSFLNQLKSGILSVWCSEWASLCV